MTPTAGQWAEIQQPGGRWLPFLVTFVHDADTVSGVAFSGQPAQVGWHRPAQDFAGVKRGERNREWRETGLVVHGETGELVSLMGEELDAKIHDMATEALAKATTDSEPDAPPAEQPAARRGRKPTA